LENRTPDRCPLRRPHRHRLRHPARYASTRLPGKPLLAIAGRPMIEHVYRRVEQAGG